MAMRSNETYERLARLPMVESYQEAFRKATGIALKLAPPVPPPNRICLGEHENGFCALVARHPAAGMACWKTETEAQCAAAKSLKPQTVCCMAGLYWMAVPVVVSGEHVATWVGGQVFQRQPTRSDFRRVSEQLARLGVSDGWPQIEAAFFKGRIVATEQFDAALQLLCLCARHLGESAEDAWALPQPDEPLCVARAKEFVQAHVTESVSFKQVAAVVRLSPFHFCRVFRTATGLTFTEYVSRLRVEEAKKLLANLSVRVSEVTFAAGFGSIPQFNAVFRKYAGMSPTQYRAARQESGSLFKRGATLQH